MAEIQNEGLEGLEGFVQREGTGRAAHQTRFSRPPGQRSVDELVLASSRSITPPSLVNLDCQAVPVQLFAHLSQYAHRTGFGYCGSR